MAKTLSRRSLSKGQKLCVLGVVLILIDLAITALALRENNFRTSFLHGFGAITWTISIIDYTHKGFLHTIIFGSTGNKKAVKRKARKKITRRNLSPIYLKIGTSVVVVYGIVSIIAAIVMGKSLYVLLEGAWLTLASGGYLVIYW